MKLIELEVEDIRNSENKSEAYALLLREKFGKKIIPIMIGWNEARAMVLAINKVSTKRPSPHDLFQNMMNIAGFTFESAYIHKFEEGVFFANLKMKSPEGHTIDIDSRTSDAITLSIKCNAPIYITSELFEQTALDPLREEKEEEITSKSSVAESVAEEKYIDQQLSEMTEEELANLLEGAVESEDFELASKIHEELEKRKG